MTFIAKQKDRIRDIKLTESEIRNIVELLESQPYNIFKFFNYEDVIKKLKGVGK